MTPRATVPALPELVVSDLKEFDQAPAREILVLLLAGPSLCCGGPDTRRAIERLVRGGIVTAVQTAAEAPTCAGAEGGAWFVRPAFFAGIAGLRLAASSDLLAVLGLYGQVRRRGGPWAGHPPAGILRELDLRDGGRGDVDDIHGWLRRRSHAHIIGLRRRDGLDEET